MTYKIECHQSDVPRLRDWMQHRGGCAMWTSVNLSNPGGTWVTPADAGKPSWECGNNPLVITDEKDVGVYTEKLFKAFRVGLRPGRQGLSWKLTDGAQRRLNKHMDQCRELHGSAYYRKGVLDIVGASMGVFYTDSTVPMTEVK